MQPRHARGVYPLQSQASGMLPSSRLIPPMAWWALRSASSFTVRGRTSNARNPKHLESLAPMFIEFSIAAVEKCMESLSPRVTPA